MTRSRSHSKSGKHKHNKNASRYIRDGIMIRDRDHKRTLKKSNKDGK